MKTATNYSKKYALLVTVISEIINLCRILIKFLISWAWRHCGLRNKKKTFVWDNLQDTFTSETDLLKKFMSFHTWKVEKR
jgi:hypothetical protein